MQPWLWRPQLLALGEPVTAADLAQATGRPVQDVQRALAGLPDTEYDEQGRIIGHGITLRATPHRFGVDGRHPSTWCAPDTLIFPAVLGHPALVESPCHGTGVAVHLTVELDKITSVDLAAAVVSIVTPDPCFSIRAAFCNQVHFFALPAAAQPWLDRRPGATILPVAEAFALGGLLPRTLLTADGEGGCS